MSNGATTVFMSHSAEGYSSMRSMYFTSLLSGEAKERLFELTNVNSDRNIWWLYQINLFSKYS
jgi:hypothetical protein